MQNNAGTIQHAAKMMLDISNGMNESTNVMQSLVTRIDLMSQNAKALAEKYSASSRENELILKNLRHTEDSPRHSQTDAAQLANTSKSLKGMSSSLNELVGKFELPRKPFRAKKASR